MTQMMNETTRTIDEFGRRYDYDVAYMHALHTASADGYAHFEYLVKMAGYRKCLPADVKTVAQMTTLQLEDCGPCLQLVVDMAIENGVDRALLEAALNTHEPLDGIYEDVRLFTCAVVKQDEVEPELRERLMIAYGDEGMAELALSIASSRMFPTIKRAMGYAKSCALVSVKV